jgi:hypothetical protein
VEHHASHGATTAQHDGHRMPGAYRIFTIDLAADFAVMYLVMYTMIRSFDHFRLNVDNVYMTLMMVAPMSVIMLASMRSMFTNRRLNWAIRVGAAAVFIVAFGAMRTQAAVGNEQFLKAMIPHHSGAILMCQEASLTDPEIVELCRGIVQSQQAEIAKMEALLAKDR